MVRHLEEVFFAPGVGSSLKEGVFAWVKGIGSKVSGSVLRDSWSLEARAGRELMQEKDSGAKDLPGARVCSFIGVGLPEKGILVCSGVPSWRGRR